MVRNKQYDMANLTVTDAIELLAVCGIAVNFVGCDSNEDGQYTLDNEDVLFHREQVKALAKVLFSM